MPRNEGEVVLDASVEKYMFSAVKISLIGNIILFLIKAVTFLFVHSLAVATDMGISLVALLVSIMLYYSVKIAAKPADFVHNYGYGKVEHVCELMEGIVIIGIGFAISFQAVISIINPRHVISPWIGLTTSAIGVMINIGGGLYIGLMAKKSASPAIRAEALHYYLEAFISAMITISFVAIVILEATGYKAISVYVDPIAALFVSVVIAIPSFKLAKEAFFKLLDSSIDEFGKIEIVKRLLKHVNMYCELEDVKTRISGTKKFIEFKIILPESLPFKKADRIVKFLERDMRSSIRGSEVHVRMEPCQQDCVMMQKSGTCPYLSAECDDLK